MYTNLTLTGFWNWYSLRTLLHSKARGSGRSTTDVEQSPSAHNLALSILEKSMAALTGEEESTRSCMRWELGACWMQHSQSEAAAVKEKADESQKAADGSQSDVKGIFKEHLDEASLCRFSDSLLNLRQMNECRRPPICSTNIRKID